MSSSSRRASALAGNWSTPLPTAKAMRQQHLRALEAAFLKAAESDESGPFLHNKPCLPMYSAADAIQKLMYENVQAYKDLVQELGATE
jgi:hypothetical protein